jgi:hypothetical protein
MKTLIVLNIFIIACQLASCSSKTPQQTQSDMYMGVWQPQTTVRLGSGRVGAVAGERYYGASDFFNN